MNTSGNDDPTSADQVIALPLRPSQPQQNQPRPRRLATLRILQVAAHASKIAQGRWHLAAGRDVEVLQAGDLPTALRILADEQPDAVVCPLTLEQLGPAALIRKLRAAAAQLTIVVLADKAGDPAIKRALKAGAEDFLVAPASDPQLLLKTVRQAVERRRAAAQLDYLSRHDKLTGLANRELFADRLQWALAHATRSERALAVLRIDIDRFRGVNDSLGLGAGDELLIRLAQRLQGALRGVDTIARTGSNEFSIVLENFDQAHDVDRVCHKIQATISAPLRINGVELSVTASIGVALCPDDGVSPHDLMCSVDSALEQARSAGCNRYVRHGTADTEPPARQAQLKRDLVNALAKQEFELVYQPRVNIQTGTVLGLEALIRWQHPEFGCLLPSRFIPLAEHNGLIVPLGTWVLDQACKDLGYLAEAGFGDLGVAVNLSAQQFLRGDLIPTLQDLLARYAVDPNLLIMEITETTLMEDTAGSMRQLDVLKAMGISVYLDDFGTGYCSLAYLKRFRLDGLKIDRDFIREIPHDSDDVAIARAIIALSRALQMGVIAEGVETTQQLEFVLAEGCDEAQGFLFSEALPLPALTAWLTEGGSHGGHPLLPR